VVLMTARGALKRARIIAAIEALTERNGFAPSIQEIAIEVGLSKTSCYQHLVILRMEGSVTSGSRPGAGWKLHGG